MRWSLVVLEVSWIVWAIVWALGWVFAVVRGPRTQRRVGDWQQFGILAVVGWAILRGTHGIPSIVLWHNVVMRILGALLLVLGTAFSIWARFVLGRMWSGSPGVKVGHTLQTGGPYTVTRHPIYTGMLSMGAGSFVVTGEVSIGVLWILFLVYLLLKIRVEERLMREQFGQSYLDFQLQVPQLVPDARSFRSRKT